MGAIRTLGSAAVITAGEPTPVVLVAAAYPGTIISAATVAWANGICTIVLGAAMPLNGYNGPNNAIQGNFPAPGGQQVVLWDFDSTVGLLLNGKKVTVISNNIVARSFSFALSSGSTQAATADTGKTAPIPVERYRAIRLECSQALGTDFVYVGDSNVSATQYMAALSLAGQLSIEIASDNIPPEGLFIDGTTAGDAVQVAVIY